MKRSLKRCIALVPVALNGIKRTQAFIPIVRLKESCRYSSLSVPSLKKKRICKDNNYPVEWSRLLSSGTESLAVETTLEKSPLEFALEQCWASDSWSINADGDESIDNRVRCFCSPAPPVYFALDRALRLNPASRQIEIFQIFSRTLKKGFHFVVRRQHDNDADLNGGICLETWQIIGRPEKIKELGPDWERVDGSRLSFPSTLQIAHHILALASDASERQEKLDPLTVDMYANLAVDRLNITLGTEIRGRSAADAAFAFAMAGVNHPELYKILSNISALEIARMGPRSSLPSRNILQIVEKLSAAGLPKKILEPTYKIAADLLSRKKDCPDDAVLEALKGEAYFGMHSSRSLVWLWRFASRQSKAKVPERKSNPKQKKDVAQATIEKNTRFDGAEWIHRLKDPSKPLVIDIGCGMGVSILGLSRYRHQRLESIKAEAHPGIDFSNCNFVGADLNPLFVGYSSAIAERLGLAGSTSFVHVSAQDFIEQVQVNYPGPIALVMVQFPTPFRLASKLEQDSGNSQLPLDVSSGFMVTHKLVQTIKSAMTCTSRRNKECTDALLLFQSNCEDVAVAMKKVALSSGLECVNPAFPVTALSNNVDELPQRTVAWIQEEGERPIGSEWFSKPILPRYGQTETEVACDFQKTAVHRCLLRVPNTNIDK